MGIETWCEKTGRMDQAHCKSKARKQSRSLKLLELQKTTGLQVISEEELHLIQRHWNSARNPDEGNGVVQIVHLLEGAAMPDPKDENRLRVIESEVAAAARHICRNTAAFSV